MNQKQTNQSIRIYKKHTTPLCFLTDEILLCYHKRYILVMNKGHVEKRINIPVSVKERLLGWNRLASRLLRFGVRVAIAIDDTHAIICIGNTLYEVDIERGSVSKGWHCGNGIRPLIITTIKGIGCFEDGFYFGGYLMNMDKNPVSIYRRITTDKWEVVYTFQQGAINHVHNIVPDPYRQCLWIFTGDFENASAIWKVSDNFKKVERVVCGDQKYRGCVVNALPEGLLYATDTPFADDFIYLLDTDSFKLREVLSIHGSCIYGCKWKDKYVFSSTVEGNGRNVSRLEFLLSSKRGLGIKDGFVHLYVGNLQEGFKEVYKEKKDCLPFGPFQFGVFKFPSGINSGDTLYFQPMATQKNDLSLMSLTM